MKKKIIIAAIIIIVVVGVIAGLLICMNMQHTSESSNALGNHYQQLND